jgi:hypothetical protein
MSSGVEASVEPSYHSFQQFRDPFLELGELLLVLSLELLRACFQRRDEPPDS